MIIAVVGSGGKTGRIHVLAEKYQKEGKKVLVTTTTHMMIEEGCVLSGDEAEILEKLESEGYCMAGIPAEEGKMKKLPEVLYKSLCKAADVVLVEADGSRQLPLKYPSAGEPVIPDNVDEIHVVVGLSALGKPLKEVCHRKELVLQCLNVSEDTIVEPVHLQKLVQKGYVEPLRAFYPEKIIKICPGQINNLYEKAVAEFLRAEQDVSVLKSCWFETRPKLIILGAGHVGLHVATLGHFLDFEVTVIDDRREFTEQAMRSGADFVHCHSFENVEELFPKEERGYYVVVTRKHQADQCCIEKILDHDKYAYIGMIGSRIKISKTMELLQQKGYSKQQLKEIHSPIGLNIGARTPQEIAVSIAAELVREKNQKVFSTLTKELLETKDTGVLCLITKKKGSTPRGEGSMMLVTDEGILGSSGGGLVEMEVISKAREITKITKETFSLSGEAAEKNGMICGGSNEVFFVPIKNML